jgi:glucuronate isomerase
LLHADRLLPAEPGLRKTARSLYERIEGLPIVSPHGHVPVAWFAPEFRFGDATDLLIRPDHYVLRMFASQGFAYEDLGVAGQGAENAAGSRAAFRTFAEGFDLFLGTPTRAWIEHALHAVLGVTERLTAESADRVFDAVNARLAEPAFTPRALFDRFGIEVLATTDSAVDDLAAHHALAADPGFGGRVIPTFRPDSVTDPEHRDFGADIARLAELTGEDVARWPGYLAALAARRSAFREAGATATDHGFQRPLTARHSAAEAQALLDAALSGRATPEEARAFRAQMLFEMARMSREDGMVMQIHAGSWRNYAPDILARFGLDKGFDIPQPTAWARDLKPLLDAFGFERNLSIVLYTLDETTYSRELAPLAGAFPTLRLGAPWWFFDSPNGMARHFDAVVETAGFRNLAGFVDDTRALMSIPARHDMYRRAVAATLARLVGTHQIGLDDAHRLAEDLAVGLARDTYRLAAGREG